MRINEVIVEDTLDELSLGGIGRGIGKAVGGVARGVGSVAGGAVGAMDAVKQGFNTGRGVVNGTAPAATPSTPTSTPTTTQGNTVAPQRPGVTAPQSQSGTGGQGNASVSSPQPQQNTQVMKTQLAKLQKQVAALQTQLRTTPTPQGASKPASAATSTPAAKPAVGGAGAFGGMASQLAQGPAASSTGGTTNTVAPGVTSHTAAQGNPNQAGAGSATLGAKAPAATPVPSAQPAVAGATTPTPTTQPLNKSFAPAGGSTIPTVNGKPAPVHESATFHSKFLGIDI